MEKEPPRPDWKGLPSPFRISESMLRSLAPVGCGKRRAYYYAPELFVEKEASDVLAYHDTPQ